MRIRIRHAHSRCTGLSQLELLVLLAVIGIIAGVGTIVIGVSSLDGSREVRLDNQLNILNSAVNSYLAFGGSIQSGDSAGDILARLKTPVSEEQRRRTPGLSGSLIDRSVSFVMQTEKEAQTSAPRILWDAKENRFVLSTNGPPGIKKLVRSDSPADSEEFVESDREHRFLYAEDGNWIWDYEDAEPDTPIGVTAVPTGNPPGNSVPAAPIAPPSSKKNLQPPGYSITSGDFPAHTFPLTLFLSNPNPAGTGSIFYSVNYGGWMEADPEQPILISADSSIKAQSIPFDSSSWNPSKTVDELYYAYREQLRVPLIDFSKDHFFTDKKSSTDSIEVSLTDQNPAELSSLLYQLLPLPGTSGPVTDFQVYQGPFRVSSADYPNGFGVRAYASAIKIGYDDSRKESRYATEEKGLFGGHLDLDTSTTLSRVARGSTDSHTHDITGKYGINEINFFSIPVEDQIEITEAITDPSQQFKLTVVNGDLSPGLNLQLSYELAGKSYTIDQSVVEYDDTDIENLTVFSLGGAGNSAKLTGLRISMGQDVIYQAGVIPTNTGDVKANILGKRSEWRNGSLTLQAVAVDPSGNDTFTTDENLSSGDHGAAQSGLFWEAALFWHWDGDSYHEDRNTYVPGEFQSISKEVGNPGEEYLSAILALDKN